MSIKIGNLDVNKIYLVNSEINKAYLGSKLIFDNSSSPSDMSNFGSIVSGYEADSVVGVDGDPISTLVDQYGNNDGTSSNSAQTTLEIVSGEKEIDFSGGHFNLGQPATLNFLPQGNFSFVWQLGSRVTSATDQYLIGKRVLALEQYTIVLDSAAGGEIRSHIGNDFIDTNISYSANDIFVMTWDSTGGTEGTFTLYKNGVSVYTENPVGLSNTERLGDIALGDIDTGGGTGVNYDGSIKGFWIYGGALDQTSVTNIQTFLTT